MLLTPVATVVVVVVEEDGNIQAARTRDMDSILLDLKQRME